MSTTEPLVMETVAIRRRSAAVEIVIPVHNEQDDLAASIYRLAAYLDERFPLSWLITIADNASTDHTWAIAGRLAVDVEGVRAVRLNEKGRGRALRATWSASTAEVVAYMDVDLSTDLDALLPLVAPLLSGHSDVAIGSRLAPGARVVRGPKREVISRVYNLVLKATLHNEFSDAQCGFKAVRREVAQALLPLVEDEGWFFDTELLVLAEHNGLRIHEVPVDWVDDPDSRVDVAATAIGDLRGIGRLLRRFATTDAAIDPPSLAEPSGQGRLRQVGLAGQLIRFAGVGLVSSVLFAMMFLLLARPLGPILADVVSLALCSVLNLAANRRITFSHRGARGRRRHYLAGAVLTVLPLVATLVTLVLAGMVGITSPGADLLAVSVVNLVVATARFAALRSWVLAETRTGDRR
jgi:putative flippase GtrA